MAETGQSDPAMKDLHKLWADPDVSDDTRQLLIQQGFVPPIGSPSQEPSTGTLRLTPPPTAPPAGPSVPAASMTPGQRIPPEELLRLTGVGQEFKSMDSEHLQKLAEGVGLDLGLAYAGGAAGGYLGRGNPLAITAGQTAGSWTSQQIKKALGLVPKDDKAAEILSLAPAVGAAPELLRLGLRYGTKAGAVARTAEQMAEAVQTARGITTPTIAEEGFRPDVPSQALYAEFTKAHGADQPGLSPARQAAANVYLESGPMFPAAPPRGLVPPGAITPKRVPPSRIDLIANDIAQFPEGTTVETLHDYLRAVRKAVRETPDRDGKIRDWGRQLEEGLHDSMNTLPGVAEDLAPANAAYRREKALENLDDVMWRATRKDPDTQQPRLVPKPLLDWHHDLSQPDLDRKQRLIRGSFTDDEWQRLGRNFDDLARMVPTGPKDLPPFNWRKLEAEMVAGGTGAGLHYATGTPASGALAAAGTAMAAYDALNHGLSKVFLMPRGNPMIKRLVQFDGTLDPRAVAIFNAAYQQDRLRNQDFGLPEIASFKFPQAVQEFFMPPQQQGQQP